jgi:hypothetical protein
MGQESKTMPHIHWDNLYPENRDISHLGNPISIEEIKGVIAAWPNNKSPGTDGFTGEFYKRFVDTIAPDIHSVLTIVTSQNITLEPLNTSFIILIPKNENPQTPTDFRPISLVHAIQRIFSKILSNRLQDEIQHLVDCAQTGFVKNRQITEGYVYAQHILHHARQTNLQLAIFKADIRKAFDTISWEFILAVLCHLNFPTEWCNWIKNSVLGGSSQLIINGLAGKKIILK